MKLSKQSKPVLYIEWVPYMKAYRVYDPKKYSDTIAYVDSIDELEHDKYYYILVG